MTPRVMQEKLLKLVERKDYNTLRAALSVINPVDVAAFIEELPIDQALIIFRKLPTDTAAEVFAEFSPEDQQVIISSITDREIREIIDELWMDDAVDMLEEMPPALVRRVLRNSSPETRILINEYLQYPDNTAGSIMTAEYTALEEEMTVADAIEHIRAVGENRETVYTCYVMDNYQRLDGVITVRDLLIAHDSETIGEIMDRDIISVTTNEDRESAAKLLAKYDLDALPVVDKERHLVGIITVDDALNVLLQETTEDFEKMAAVTPSEKPYLKTSVWRLALNRFPWLLLLMVSSMFTGIIMGHYEAVYASIPMLVFFTPMLTGTGGNAGSQASTMVIRAMAIGDVSPKDFIYVIWKEFRVSITVGVVLALLNYVRIVLTYPDSGLVPLIVALSQMGAVVMAKTIGGGLPLLAKALRVDPALVAAPLITTIVDALTLILYFSLASNLLPW